MRTHRIFLTGSGIAPEARGILDDNACIVGIGEKDDSPEVLAEKLKSFDPDGIIVRQGQITSAVQDAAHHLKVICKHGVGTDNIDVDAASRRGIPVLFTPRANFESAAQHTLALLLSLLRRIPNQDRAIRDGVFEKGGYPGQELTGKTLGLIGFGRIGRRFAELVAPMDVSVLVYHPGQAKNDLPANVSRVASADRVFDLADIISLHCPLTERTRELINRTTIARMKDGVFIINTARVAIVDQEHLIEALKVGKVAGAGLDVFQSEPVPVGHPLLGLDNVVLTAHVAGISDKSFVDMGRQAVHNVLAVLEGERPDDDSIVNLETLAKPG